MRVTRFIIPLVVLGGIVWCGVRVWGFVQLFFEHDGIGLDQREVMEEFERDRANGVLREEKIPRIIHQVFHNWRGSGNESIPGDWEEVRRSCREMNGGWKYNLWTETTSQDFIREHYPWFLETYKGYHFPVQRVDSVRYFLLLHFGGIYLDLDNGCLTSLDALLTYPTWTTDGGRGALSNNILASEPNHPFWKLLTDSLIPYNYNYFFPYITISYASGQWFETAIWQKYHKLLRQGKIPGGYRKPLHRVMMDDRDEKRDGWIFFRKGRGGTWVNWDNYFFLWIGDHLVLESVVILWLVGSVWWGLLRWFGYGNRKRRARYVTAKGEDGEA